MGRYRPCHYKSSVALDALCQKNRMSQVQALRYLLRIEAETPLPGITIARTVTDPRTGDREIVLKHIRKHIRPGTQAPEPDPPLPNAFPAALQKMRELFRDGNPAIVGLYSRVNLCMDDRSKQGLLVAMTRYNTDHQNALRQLLIDKHRQGEW